MSVRGCPDERVPVGVDDHESSAGSQDADELLERGVRLGEVLDDLHRHSGVEGGVCKLKRGRVALQDLDPVGESGVRDPL